MKNYQFWIIIVLALIVFKFFPRYDFWVNNQESIIFKFDKISGSVSMWIPSKKYGLGWINIPMSNTQNYNFGNIPESKINFTPDNGKNNTSN